MPKPVDTLALHLSQKSDGPHQLYEVSVLTVGPTTADYRPESISGETLRNPDSTGRPVNGFSVTDLRITAQASSDMRDGKAYGWQVSYRDVFSVDAARAGQMAKTLQTIEKRMEQTTKDEGQPADFAAFVARVAKALKITRFVTLRGGARGWSYDDNEYRHMDGAGAVDLLRCWEREHQEKLNKVAA